MYVYLLVEWVDKNSLIPEYDIVSIIPEKYNGVNLRLGNDILILKRGEAHPRQGHILRISGTRQSLLDQKSLLEDQSISFRNHLSKSIIIDEVDQRNYDSTDAELQSRPPSSVQRISPADISFTHLNEENNSPYSVNRRYIHNYPTQKEHFALTPREQDLVNEINRRRALMSHHKRSTKSKKDKAVQTDPEEDQISDEMKQFVKTDCRMLLKQIYRGFVTMFGGVEGVSEVIASLPDLTRELGYNTDDEVVAAQNVNIVNSPMIFQDEICEGGQEKVMDIIEPIQNVNDENKESVDNSREISPPSNSNVQTPIGPPDLVAIGNGYAWVPERLLKEMNWSSYTSATRQLLQAIFSRRVLATHSLTGKQSPAFANKPAKKCLDPRIVEDIVLTVSTQCGVPKRLVRNSITIKCTDEAKLYRKRQQFKRREQREDDRPPHSTPSEETSSITD